jgi:hypothetical protein
VPDIRSFSEADYDTNHYLVVAKVRERLAVNHVALKWRGSKRGRG